MMNELDMTRLWQEAQAVVTACFAMPSKDAGSLSPAILATHAYGSDLTAEEFLHLSALCQKVSERATSLFKQSMAAAFR